MSLFSSNYSDFILNWFSTALQFETCISFSRNCFRCRLFCYFGGYRPWGLLLTWFQFLLSVIDIFVPMTIVIHFLNHNFNGSSLMVVFHFLQYFHNWTGNRLAHLLSLLFFIQCVLCGFIPFLAERINCSFSYFIQKMLTYIHLGLVFYMWFVINYFQHKDMFNLEISICLNKLQSDMPWLVPAQSKGRSDCLPWSGITFTKHFILSSNCNLIKNIFLGW